MPRVFVSPYTLLEFNILPFDAREVGRLYDIVAKRDLAVVEEFLRRRITDESYAKVQSSAVKTPISFNLKQFEFEVLLVEILKEYTDVVEAPSLTNPNTTETFSLKHLVVKKTQPKKFYLQSVLKDYQIEKELEKMFASYIRLVEGEQAGSYEKAMLVHNMQMSMLLIKAYNLQKEFENRPVLETNFQVTQEVFKLIGEYNKERPKIIDKVTGEEFKPRPDVFSAVLNSLTGFVRGAEEELE